MLTSAQVIFALDMLPVWWKLCIFYFLSVILCFQNGFSWFWVISATKTIIFYSKFHDLPPMVTVQTEIIETSGLCGYFFGSYRAAEAQNHPVIARFVRFRQRRCGFKKIRSKIIIFSLRSRLLKIGRQRCILKKNTTFGPLNDFDL